MIVSYDPGAKVAGVALWDDNQLCEAWLVRGDNWGDTAHVAFRSMCERVPTTIIHTFVIEIPQVYVQRKQVGDPNDLIIVALNAGAFGTYAGFCGGDDGAEVYTFRPHEWKGQVPKHIAIKRFQKRLSDDERRRVCITKVPKSLQHNVWDSVGLGLYHTGRR